MRGELLSSPGKLTRLWGTPACSNFRNPETKISPSLARLLRRHQRENAMLSSGSV